MLVFLYGVSIYVTFANAWFFMSALVSDVLWIRFYLLMAYIFLLIAGLTNYPTWGTWNRVNGSVWLLGAIIWPFVTGSFHLHGFLSLLLDERKIRFRSKDEEQLWRMVHRRSGMGRLEFKHSMKLGRWIRFPKGATIFDSQGNTAKDAQCVHLMVDGTATMSVMHGKEMVSRTMRCGYLFDLAICNIFGVYIGLERSPIEKVVAETDVLLVRWEIRAVEKMANGSYPALSAFWRNLILYNVGAAFSSTCGDVYASNGQNESVEFHQGGRSRDMTEPFLKEEEDHTSFFQWIKNIIKLHNPIAPPGLRHNSMPTSGMLAKGRILAHETSDQASVDFRSLASKLSVYHSAKLELDPYE